MSICTMMNTAAELSNEMDVIDCNQFYSVEFSVDNVKFLYQFKIWNSPSSPMFVLIKNGSTMLEHIRTGDILNMKYYSNDTRRPTCHLETKILNIHWNGQGKFKGHYAVALRVMEDRRTPTPSA